MPNPSAIDVFALEPALPPGLVRTTDAEPGILRRRRGKGFAYLRHDGSPVRDGRELQRIRSLAIPPAYREVWICPLANGHLQATGLDARGRKQYRYHAQWRIGRDEEKFDRLPLLAARLPRIRRGMARDLQSTEHGRPALLAVVVKLLDTTLGRIGNDAYARENGSFGLTTLRNRHARLQGDRLELEFRGKSGISQCLELRDPAVARVLRRCLKLPGQTLFRYADEAGRIHRIASAEVNDYLRSLAGEQISAKDFRTWHATVLALEITERAVRRGDTAFTLKKLLAEVSQALGNTPAVCRKSYVHPEVLALATLASRDLDAATLVLHGIDEQLPNTPGGLRRSERRLLAFGGGGKGL